jgi:erythromycin esterase
MQQGTFLLRISLRIICCILLFISCQEKEIMDETTRSLVETLEDRLDVLNQNPNTWTDQDLRFIDEFSDARVIGLGEATHGTHEFFEAKHRIFRYLVENHGFNVYAFEADFGECVYINDAVQKGETASIRNLMTEKMIFWTWKTKEVQHLLEWMCSYNQDKTEEDKIQYIGVDCQFNKYNTTLLKEFLAEAGPAISDYADDIIDSVKNAHDTQFENYNNNSYSLLLNRINTLIDTVKYHESEIVSISGNETFQFYAHMLEVLKQSFTVRFYSHINDHSRNYRDEYMAKNVEWILDQDPQNKVVIWAHNYHVAGNPPSYGGTGGSMGYHLKNSHLEDYKVLGFSFSKGSFRAVGQDGKNYTGLKVHEIAENPLSGSLNEIFSNSVHDCFGVSMDRLLSDPEWNNQFEVNQKMLSLGAVYNGNPESYYSEVNRADFDVMIYFHTTLAAEEL